ncbi:hypothetical protein DK37_11345 [Halomonas sp. SUBG004]|nr:hypothetical protein DK37_11345 [Halomonas sp. SUBG004]
MISGLSRYPEPSYRVARCAIAEHEGVAPEQVLLTNGGADAILAAALHTGQRGLIVTPTFGEYARACAAHRLVITEHALEAPPFRPTNGSVGRACHTGGCDLSLPPQ